MSSNSPSTPVVAVRDLRFRYMGMRHDALRMSSFVIDQPGLIAITGPSGAGKSTLMELLAGTLNERYSGTVEVLGKEWSELRSDRSRQFHLRRIGLIPQDLGLLPNQTPRQMIRQALLDADVPARECDDRVANALARMDLEPFADRRIAELSGGQKQRVAIARVLVRNVELILADEPTANLNAQLSNETIDVLRRIGQTIPVVIVTHDPRVAEMCDRQVRLEAPPADVAPAAIARPVMPVAPPRRLAPTPAPTPILAPARASAPAPIPARAVPAHSWAQPQPQPAPATAEKPLPQYRKVAILAVATISGVSLLGFGLSAAFSAGAKPAPVAQTAQAAVAVVSSPTPPPGSPTPSPASPASSPSTVAPAPQTVVAKTHYTTPKTARTTVATQQPAVTAQPVTPAAAPAATTTPTPTPSASPTPGFLQWWQSMGQVFGYPTPAPTPQPTRSPKPSPTSTPAATPTPSPTPSH